MSTQSVMGLKPSTGQPLFCRTLPVHTTTTAGMFLNTSFTVIYYNNNNNKKKNEYIYFEYALSYKLSDPCSSPTK
jgi:hypothetical protein